MLPVERLRPRNLKPDLAIALILSVIAFAAYVLTLAPSVAPGDVAELQYIPARLGIPHPNGFPLYLLLGKTWSLLPLGSLAWRMNLLSAVFGALGVAALYLLLRVSGLPRASSASAALVWGFQRTFWAWSTVADRYSLLLFLAIASYAALLGWRRSGRRRWLWLAALAAGCLCATHVAAPLYLLPAGILLLWPRSSRAAQSVTTGPPALRRGDARAWIIAAALFAAPLLLYAYVPLRGAALWRASPVDPVWAQPRAVLAGLIHPRFDPDPTTLLGYLRAGNPIDPARLLPDLVARRAELIELFRTEFGLLWLIPAALGLLLAVRRHIAWGLALVALLVADTILAAQYWQGNAQAYFLPAMLVLTIGLAESAGFLQRQISRLDHPWLSALTAAALLVLPTVPLLRNVPDARTESRALDAYWREALSLPIEPGAGLLAHWSDLTPLWYFQQAEGLRPDAQGLYLPDADQLEAAVAQGRPIYLSGPLSGWYPDLAARAQLIPWGPFVRFAPLAPAAPPTARPTSAPAVSFGDTIALASVSVPAAPALPGATAPLTLTWRSLAPVSRDMHISFRLKQGAAKIAQQDDRVVTPWFPSPEVASGLDFWSRHNLRVPLGLAAGEYELSAVVYDLGGPELRPSSGDGEARLGTLRIGAEPPGQVAFSLAPTLGPCIRIEQERPRALQTSAGALLDLDLLFALRCQPADGTVMRFSLAGAGRTYPLHGAAGPAEWRAGGHQREPFQVRIPVDILPGVYELRVEAADGAGSGSLARRLGPLPLPSQEPIGEVRVETRPFATDAPPLAHTLDAPFDNGMRLLGFDRPSQAVSAAAPITVTLAWRAEAPIPQGYQLFIHLLGPDGAIMAQRDAPPGELPTQAWLPGEVVSATHALQPSAPLPPGEYRLVAGLYDLGTMQRALVNVPGQPPADHVELGAIGVQ